MCFGFVSMWGLKCTYTCTCRVTPVMSTVIERLTVCIVASHYHRLCYPPVLALHNYSTSVGSIIAECNCIISRLMYT